MAILTYWVILIGWPYIASNTIIAYKREGGAKTTDEGNINKKAIQL